MGITANETIPPGIIGTIIPIIRSRTRRIEPTYKCSAVNARVELRR